MRSLTPRTDAVAYAGAGLDALMPGAGLMMTAGAMGAGAANLAKLVSVMREVPEGRRGAKFVCVLLVCGPGGEEKIFEGESAGRLAHEPKGGAGFGYDPLFVPEGYEHSFAELGDAVKAGISHRARAWARLAEWVRGRA